MPRDLKPSLGTVDDHIRMELFNMQQRLDRLNRQSTATVRQAAPSLIADPLEGEIIIDPTTNEIKWYSSGVWRQCVSNVAFNPEILISANPGNGYKQIYALDPVTSVTQMLTPGDEITYYYPVWSGDRTKVYVEGFALNSSRRMNVVNLDGTNFQELFTTPDVFTNGIYTHSQVGQPVRFAICERVSPWRIVIYEEDGSSSVAWNGSTQSSYGYYKPWSVAFSPDGTKLFVALQNSVSHTAGFWLQISTNVMDITYNGSAVANPGVRWKQAENERVYMYILYSKIQTFHYYDHPTESPVDIFYLGGNYSVISSRCSPDGTKIAFMYSDYTTEYSIKVIDWDGNVLGTGETNENFNHLAWSPDSTKLICTYNSTEAHIFDVPSMTRTTLLSLPSNAAYVEWSNPTWMES